MLRFDSKKFDLVYKTSITPFFPICLCGRNYSVKYAKLANLKIQPEPVIAVVEHDIVSWFFPKSLSQVAHQVMDRFFVNDVMIKKIRRQEKSLARSLLVFIKKPIGLYFTRGILNTQGKKQIQKLFKLYTEYAYYVDVPGFLFQLYYVKKYQSFIKKQCGHLKLTQAEMSLLLCLPNLTNFEKFNLEIIKAVKAGLINKNLNQISKKYYWIIHDYLGYIVDEKYLKKYVVKLKKHLAEETIHIKEANERIKNIKQVVNRLPPLAQKNAKKLHELMWFYNDRKKEVLSRVNIYIRSLVNKRFSEWGIKKIHKLYQFSPPEIVEILANANKVDIDSRAKLYVHQIAKMEFVSGDKTLVNLIQPANDSRVLRGVVTMPGKVSGRVSIVLNISQISKFKKGDILVAPFTNVNYLPIMRQAKAILTETGGVTSHAAIISRELKIPCIVGIKNLISSLRDGDKVEVDANKGIVRRL